MSGSALSCYYLFRDWVGCSGSFCVIADLLEGDISVYFVLCKHLPFWPSGFVYFNAFSFYIPKSQQKPKWNLTCLSCSNSICVFKAHVHQSCVCVCLLGRTGDADERTLMRSWLLDSFQKHTEWVLLKDLALLELRCFEGVASASAWYCQQMNTFREQRKWVKQRAVCCFCSSSQFTCSQCKDGGKKLKLNIDIYRLR